MSCAGTSVFNQTANECVCPSNSYLQETDATGALLTTGKICSPCAPSAYKGPPGLQSKCERC